MFEQAHQITSLSFPSVIPTWPLKVQWFTEKAQNTFSLEGVCACVCCKRLQIFNITYFCMPQINYLPHSQIVYGKGWYFLFLKSLVILRCGVSHWRGSLWWYAGADRGSRVSLQVPLPSWHCWEGCGALATFCFPQASGQFAINSFFCSLGLFWESENCVFS